MKGSPCHMGIMPDLRRPGQLVEVRPSSARSTAPRSLSSAKGPDREPPVGWAIALASLQYQYPVVYNSRRSTARKYGSTAGVADPTTTSSSRRSSMTIKRSGQPSPASGSSAIQAWAAFS